MFAFMSVFLNLKKLWTLCALAKKAIYKYIDLIVETYEEYFEISFFGWGSPSEFSYGHSLYYRGRTRPKSNGCRCERKGSQNFLLFRGHKGMTPKWKYYRNLCKNLKILVCVLYVSKLL